MRLLLTGLLYTVELEPSLQLKGVCTQFCEQKFDPGSFEDYDDRIEMAWWLLEKNTEDLPGKNMS